MLELQKASLTVVVAPSATVVRVHVYVLAGVEAAVPQAEGQLAAVIVQANV